MSISTWIWTDKTIISRARGGRRYINTRIQIWSCSRPRALTRPAGVSRGMLLAQKGRQAYMTTNWARVSSHHNRISMATLTVLRSKRVPPLPLAPLLSLNLPFRSTSSTKAAWSTGMTTRALHVTPTWPPAYIETQVQPGTSTQEQRPTSIPSETPLLKPLWSSYRLQLQQQRPRRPNDTNIIIKSL